MIYALTERDVAWIGNAAAVAGGFVTAWGEEDNASALPVIIRRKTGRQSLGTMPGLDTPIEADINGIIVEAERDMHAHTSNHRCVLAGNARTAMWIGLIRGGA